MELQKLAELDKKFHMPTYNRLPVNLIRGKGVKVWDNQGKEYFDCIAGLGVMNLGHSHPLIVETLCQQARELMHVTNLFFIEPQIELAKKIIERTFPGKCFFANSGAEANEGAIKLARKYSKKMFGPGKSKIITAWNSFHGRTLGMLSATGQEKKKDDFEPLVPGFVHVRLNEIEELEKVIDKETCALLLEPIQGEGGVYPADKGYLEKARSLCDQKEVLLIFDEVQTGMGRTGTLFAYQNFGVRPDIITIAKGLGSGLPIGCFVAQEKIANVFKPGDHGSTFGGGPLVTKVAGKVLEIIDDEFLQVVQKTSRYFRKELEKLISKYPDLINEIRGLGLLIGLELTEPLAEKITLDMLDKGVIVNNIGDYIIRLLPPLIIETEQIDLIIDIMDQSMGTIGVKNES